MGLHDRHCIKRFLCLFRSSQFGDLSHISQKLQWFLNRSMSSDFHNIVCVTTKLSLSKRSPNVISYRTLKNFNDDAFVCDLFQLSEAMVYCNRDINWCMQYFSTCLYDIVNLHAPIKTKTIRQSSVPYMNIELRKLNYQRNMMRNLKNKHPSQRNYEKYRILINKCVKVKKPSERTYLAERCDGGPKSQHF